MTMYLVENIGEVEEHVQPKGEKKPVLLGRGQNLIGEFDAERLKEMSANHHLRVSKRTPKADPAPEPVEPSVDEPKAEELTKAEQKAPSAKA